MLNDTIVALSTAIGRGAISVIRLSGDNAKNIVSQMFKPFPSTPRNLCRGVLSTTQLTDDAMCVYFNAPNSFDGEDIVELHTHGGMALSSEIINHCISLGARLAQNGEFSKRAFINGKLNLTNAEGMIEVINAESLLQIRNGQQLLNNKLIERLTPVRDVLIDLISKTEIALDYPDEFNTVDNDVVLNSLSHCKQIVKHLLDTVSIGRIISSGVNIVLVGAPNVGKSQLLNCLSGINRAIVSEVAGTTRDTLDISEIYNNVKFNYVDTAGLHDTTDRVESLGIERSHQAILTADIVLLVAEQPILSQNEQQLIDSLTIPFLLVYNKCDCVDYTNVTNGVVVSALNGTNIVTLKQMIFDKVCQDVSINNDIVLTNSRHIDILTRLLNLLDVAINSCESSYDILMLNVTQCLIALNELSGVDSTEQVLNNIFDKFCIGK